MIKSGNNYKDILSEQLFSLVVSQQWKSISRQSIGWNTDLNTKDASILSDKDVESTSPIKTLFYNHHLALDEKRRARDTS